MEKIHLLRKEYMIAAIAVVKDDWDNLQRILELVANDDKDVVMAAISQDAAALEMASENCKMIRKWC